ncbi:hypothetical protein MBLNU459_g1633t1 [Dothideomycetes sp. NU459]
MSSEQYNESRIIALVTEYYQLLFSLCYISAEDIDFPPTGGREIDEALCQSLNLTPEVVSLMRHLPCPCEEGIMLDIDLFIPASFANSFVNRKLIGLGRDPEIAERMDFLAPTDIALSIMGDEGAYLVLDTAKNTLRVGKFDGPLDPEDEDEPNLRYDFDPASESDHYTRFPVHDPTEFLKSCIDKVRSLHWIPRRVYGRGVITTDGPEVREFFYFARGNFA